MWDVEWGSEVLRYYLIIYRRVQRERTLNVLRNNNCKTKVEVTRPTGLGSLSRLPRKIQYNIEEPVLCA